MSKNNIPPEVSEYMANIGRKGGTKSKGGGRKIQPTEGLTEEQIKQRAEWREKYQKRRRRMKIKTEKEKTQRAETTHFFVNDILVAVCERGGDYFCTVSRSGNPSNIRNKWKRTFRTSWKHSGIREVIGREYDDADFKDDYPNTRWGHQGSVLTKKRVKEIFEKYLCQQSA